MNPLTFRQLRDANRVRCEGAFHPIDEWTPMEWGAAAAGELGELCNLLKKVRRGDYDGKPYPKQEIAHELADTVIYLDLLAERIGIDLGEAVREKFNIVSDRRGSEVKL